MGQLLFSLLQIPAQGLGFGSRVIFLLAADGSEDEGITVHLGYGFQCFQAVEGLFQVLADRGGAMAFHEEDVGSFCGFGTGRGQFRRSRRRIGYGRHRSQDQGPFGDDVRPERDTGYGQGRRRDGMGVDDGPDVFPLPINFQVKGRFRRGLPRPFQDVAVEVDDEQVLRLQFPFGHA